MIKKSEIRIQKISKQNANSVFDTIHFRIVINILFYIKIQRIVINFNLIKINRQKKVK